MPLPPIPEAYAVADWRRRIADLYAELRALPAQEGWRLWHTSRSQLFREHPASPLPTDLRGDFPQIDIFDYDPALRFAVDLRPITGGTLSFDLGNDGIMKARPIARTDGLANALGGELTAWWIEGYGGGLFIPFKDTTSGNTSYGGGRYAVDAIKSSDLGLDKDGRLILDFNFAYTPSCAWSAEYVCPLSPPENTLPSSVSAGERWVT